MGAYGSPDLSVNQNRQIHRNDFRKCPNCGFLYSKALKRCPRCASAPKRAFYKQWWFWMLMVFATLISLRMCIGCAGIVRNAMLETINELETTNETESSVTNGTQQSEPKTYISEEIYKSQCIGYTYEELARKPYSHIQEKVTFTGEVLQVVEEDGNDVTILVNVTKGVFDIWSDTIYVNYTRKSIYEDRILENDIITLYGTMEGMYSYTTVLETDNSVPCIQAEYIDIYTGEELQNKEES